MLPFGLFLFKYFSFSCQRKLKTGSEIFGNLTYPGWNMQGFIKICIVTSLLFTCFAAAKKHKDDDKLLSKKSKSKDACDADDESCGKPLPKSTSEMMDETSSMVVDLAKKYLGQFASGELDLQQIAKSDTGKKLMQMFIQGSMPGGNPTIAALFKVFQTATKQMGKWEKGLKKDGLNLKAAMDQLHDVVNQVIPGIVIAVQHSNKKCRRQALCRAARTAADTEAELPQAVSSFFSYAAASYLDYKEKSKKGEHIKIVECCRSEDRDIFKKCSAKYMDATECSSDLLLTADMLQPIDYSQLEFLKTYLPTL